MALLKLFTPLDEPPDKFASMGGLVVLGAGCTLFISAGLQYTCSVVYRALLLDTSLGGDRGGTSWVISISYFMYVGVGLLVGKSMQKLGPRIFDRHGTSGCWFRGQLVCTNDAGALRYLWYPRWLRRGFYEPSGGVCGQLPLHDTKGSSDRRQSGRRRNWGPGLRPSFGGYDPNIRLARCPQDIGFDGSYHHSHGFFAIQRYSY